MGKYKLDFQLVPDGCWYTNLRSALPKQVWDSLRRAAYARAGGKCSICGARGRLEAHEVWSYDDKKHLQKLEDVIAVCPACGARFKAVGKVTECPFCHTPVEAGTAQKTNENTANAGEETKR